MRFKILGPLEISDDDGRPIPVTRRLHRLTLAMLLLSAGQPCSQGDLIAGLWGDEPPLSPDVSLRSCVYGIRKLLPDAGRLRTHPAGYLIKVGAGELDLHCFADLAGQGRAALDAGDPSAAAALLSRAIGLWREPLLADVPAIGERARLLDQRNEVKDALMDARLALGQHRQVLAELRGAVADDPLREHAWAQLITALYRCGDRAQALAAFGRLRLTLVSAYGIEPGPELQDLHRQVLADDPALLSGPRLAAAASRAPWQPPGQLPASVADFTGRGAELAELRERLTGDAMTVTAVTGMLGTGKTALAVHAAHQARARFPDGQLYACLDDGGRPRDPQVVLGELLRGLAVPPDAIPEPGLEREALYRSVLAGRRVLVLADGAASAAQVRPLLPGTAGSAVLVTSRAQLADLDGARLIQIGGLRPADSAALIGRICGSDLRDAGQATAVEAIAAACDHLPLALRIAGARLAGDPGLTPQALAALLADETRLLDQLVVGDVSARARLDAAARSVGAPARRALALLSAAGQRDAAGSLIASLLDDPGAPDVAPALADAGLLRRVGGQDGTASYRMHPLVRAYAGELLADVGPGLVGSATGRLLASGWLDLAGHGERGARPRSGRITSRVGS